MAEQAEFWSFPTNPGDFDGDERISFSRLDNKHIAVQNDGAEYEFDKDLKGWVPVIEDALIEEQQGGYMMHSADDDQAVGPSAGRKRRHDSSNDREDNNGRPPRNGNKRQATRQPKQNSAIYVTGLPLDATVDEVHELFSRKCGVIAEEIDSGRPRIKLYNDADGNFKGDSLVVFFKPQSVDMAIMLLDDSDFRFTPTGTTSGKMRVQAADASYKKTKYAGEGVSKDIEAVASAERTRATNDKRKDQDKQKIIKKTQKLDAKLADWDDDEPSLLNPESGKNSKADKVVVLTHMFTLVELEDDPATLLDIKEDIREECAKLGSVTNVVLYDLEAEGIVSVRFQTSESAQACVNLMHGRAFDGRTVEAFFATGKEKFRKSTKKDNDSKEDED